MSKKYLTKITYLWHGSTNLNVKDFQFNEVIMTQSQIKEYLAKAETITRKAISSKTEARKLLTKGGFCTKNGQLKKEYRDK